MRDVAQPERKLSELVLEYARDLRRNSSGGDDYPWEWAKGTADYLEELVRRAQPPAAPVETIPPDAEHPENYRKAFSRCSAGSAVAWEHKNSHPSLGEDGPLLTFYEENPWGYRAADILAASTHTARPLVYADLTEERRLAWSAGTDYANGLKSLSGLVTLTPEQSDFLHDAAEEFERLRAVPQSSGVWQPIETAPKDGTPIEACNTRHPEAPPVIVRWDENGLSADLFEPHWCDAATRAGDALYYNQNYFDFWKPTTALPRPHLARGDK